MSFSLWSKISLLFLFHWSVKKNSIQYVTISVGNVCGQSCLNLETIRKKKRRDLRKWSKTSSLYCFCFYVAGLKLKLVLINIDVIEDLFVETSKSWKCAGRVPPMLGMKLNFKVMEVLRTCPFPHRTGWQRNIMDLGSDQFPHPVWQPCQDRYLVVVKRNPLP